MVWRWFKRRSATRWLGVMADRGLKPTATFGVRSATKDKNQKSPEMSGVLEASWATRVSTSSTLSPDSASDIVPPFAKMTPLTSAEFTE